jgi:hypothetical protein
MESITGLRHASGAITVMHPTHVRLMAIMALHGSMEVSLLEPVPGFAAATAIAVMATAQATAIAADTAIAAAAIAADTRAVE